MGVDADLLEAVTGFESLPVPAGVLDLDGTVQAINPAGAQLLARPVAQILGRRAWDFAPGAEHIWGDVLASARTQGDYHGEISIATPVGPRAIHYVVGLRSHRDCTVVVMIVVELRPSPP